MMKRISYIFSALLLVMLLVACSGQKEQSGKDGFNIVGAWRGYDHNGIATDRYKLFYANHEYINVRLGGEEAERFDGLFLVNGEGMFVMEDSLLTENGISSVMHIQNDSVLTLKQDGYVTIWRYDPTIGHEALQEIRDICQGHEFHEKEWTILSFDEYRVQSKKRIYMGIGTLLVLLLMSVTGYALYGRKRRRSVERRLIQLEAERQLEAEESKKEREATEARFLQSDYYQRLQKKIEVAEPMKLRDWDELEVYVGMVAPGFRDKLNSLCHLSLQEYRVCLLLKAHISPSGIAVLTCKSQSAISTTRSRLYNKVFGKKGGSNDWDEFIASL